MKKLIVCVLASLCAIACASEEDRHVFTEQDVALREEAMKDGKMEWVDTETKTHALTCTAQESWPPLFIPICTAYTLNPPAGAFDCTDDMTVRAGEFLFFSQAGSTLNCAGFNEANTTSLASLGDYNDWVTSVKNNTSKSANLYEHSSFGGAMLQTMWIGGNQMQSVTTSNNAHQKVSSIRLN